MKKEKRYKTTSIRDKRSIVRTLNTFSKQYEYICCDDKFVDLDLEPVKYYYMDKENDYFKNSIVFSKSNAQIDSRNTDLILDAIDNMISINRKTDLKDELKDIVRNKELGNGVNTFLLNKDLSIKEIKEVVSDSKFAKKIFSQIENRVIFRRTGIYSSNNDSSTIKSKQILPIPTNLISSLNEELEYVINKLYLFEKEPIETEELAEKLENLKNKIYLDMKNKNFSLDEIISEENSSFNHPIDEEEYDETKSDAHLTTQQINQKIHNFSNENEHNEYKKLSTEYKKALEFNEQYDTDIDFLAEEIDKLIQYCKVEERLFEKIGKYEDNIYGEYENFFEKLDKHKDIFLNILLKNEWYENIPEEMIFALQKNIVKFLNDGVKYPIEDIQKFWNNNVNEELLEDLVNYFNLEEDVLDYVIMYE
jgi:hypothetical protein